MISHIPILKKIPTWISHYRTKDGTIKEFRSSALDLHAHLQLLKHEIDYDPSFEHQILSNQTWD